MVMERPPRRPSLPLYHAVPEDAREVRRALGDAPATSGSRAGGLLRVSQARAGVAAQHEGGAAANDGTGGAGAGPESGAYLGSRRGGAPTVFPTPPPAVLLCAVCEDVFANPVMLSCGHTFCSECVGIDAGQGAREAPARLATNTSAGMRSAAAIASTVTRDGRIREGDGKSRGADELADMRAACPVCASPFDPSSGAVPDAPRADAVAALTIFCRHAVERVRDASSLAGETRYAMRMATDGCRQTIPLGERWKHEESCDFATEQCGLVDDTDRDAPRACPVVVRRSAMAAHRQRCAFAKRRCRRCRRRVIARRMREHEEMCDVVECPEGCGAMLRPEDIQAHIDGSCEAATQRCDFTDDFMPALATAEAAAAFDAGGGGLDDGGADRLLNAMACGAPRGQPVRCPHRCRRSEMSAHRRTCDFRPLRCPDCNETFAARRGEQHARECPAAMVSCHNCGERLKRAQLRAHLRDECASRYVACPFAEMGCHARMHAADVAKHIEENAGNHAEMAARFAAGLASRVLALEEKLEDTRGELAAERAARASDAEAARRQVQAERARATEDSAALTAEVDWLAELARSGAENAAREARRRQREADEHAHKLYAEAVSARRAAQDAAKNPLADLRDVQAALGDLRLRVDEHKDEARASVAALLAKALHEQRSETELLRGRLRALEDRVSEDVALLMYGAGSKPSRAY